MHERLLLREKIMGDKVRGSGLAHGACRPLIAYEKRGSGFYRFYRFYRFSGFRGGSGGGAAHFVILSGGKRCMLKNGLSENMRTESKDLSAAEIWN